MHLSNIDVRRANRILVYRAILEERSITRPELATLLGLSLPTVTQNVRALIEEGLAQETGPQPSTGGRKAMLIAPVLEARVALGMDITKNHMSLAAVNLGGEILSHVRLQQPFENTKEYYALAAQTLLQFLEEQDIPQCKVLGAGISFPSIVNSRENLLVGSHVLGIHTPTQPDFASFLPFPFQLFNDATAACIAESWAAPQDSSFVFLSLSNSVGGAIVENGNILEGDNQRSGEFGHMVLVPDGRPCYCGQKGHYDPYGSALLLTEAVDGRLEDFFLLLERGQPKYVETFAQYKKYLALMIYNLLTAFDYPLVLGGYVGSFLGPYLSEIIEQVEALSPFLSKENTGAISLCHYQTEASAVGAALDYILQFIIGL